MNPKDNLQTGGESSDFMKAIQEKLLGQSGVISSTNSTLETRINDAISGVKESAVASNKALESSYGRERGYMETTASEAFTSGRAAGSGGILNMAALRSLTETTDKSLKDLQMRKEELILNNDAAAASKISDLQLKALEFQQQAQQQTFSNLLGMANLGIQTQQEERLSKQQTFQEEQTKSTIALQYGLNPTGKTLQQITQEAMVFAKPEQQARLAQLLSQTKLNNANATKALQGDVNGVTDSSMPTLINQALLFDAAGKNPVTDVEYANLIGTITKAGKLSQYYKQKQQLSLDKIKEEEKLVIDSQKPIEKELASLKNTNFNASIKRDILRKRGYSQKEIADSSVGNIIEKVISFFK